MTHLGITSIADVLSRLTKIPAIEKCHFDDEHVRFVTLEAVPVAQSEDSRKLPQGSTTPVVQG